MPRSPESTVSTRIAIAHSAAELDGLFRTRHRVLVEEIGSHFPRSDLRLMDRFDAFPGTRNVIALVDGALVGGVRLAPRGRDCPLKMLYDFGENLPKDARAGSLTRFHLLAEHQESGQRLGLSMLYMAAFLATRDGMTHLMCCPEPDAARLAQSVGFRQVSARFEHEPTGRSLVPMVLDLREPGLPLLRMAREPGMLDAFDQVAWEFHRAGDTIIRAGTEGSAAYLVVDGEVIVSVERGGPGGRAAFELATLGPGQLFGELALLTDRVRTANVIAATEVDLMVLEREVFRRELVRRPEMLPAILEQLADRLAHADDLLTR
jgi:N-acyl-L-homoserine lactone synthetase